MQAERQASDFVALEVRNGIEASVVVDLARPRSGGGAVLSIGGPTALSQALRGGCTPRFE